MTVRLRSILFALFTPLFLGAGFAAFAEDEANGHALSDRIAVAHRSGTSFLELNIFRPAAGNKHPEMLEQASILRSLPDEVSNLYQSRPEAVSLTVRAEDGSSYKLEMLRAQLTPADANMGYIDASGRHRSSFEAGLHYQGAVAGTTRSLASMSVFASGEVMILFANGSGNFVLGRLEDGSGNYILYNDKHMRSRPENPCAVSDEDYDAVPKAPSKAKVSKAMLCNKVQFYWEVTYNVYTNKSSNLVTTQNYITGLFNQFQTMYANEKIAVELKSMYVWTSQDDYPTTNSNSILTRIRNLWGTMGNGFDGDMAHVISRTNNGNGGIAYVDGLCNRSFAYAYSDIHGSFNTVPTFSWDVEVVTHETGHNLGSKHTHWCGWMTGSGGSCGSIDNCTAQEASTGCSSCGATSLNSAPTSAWAGTVMSYCHLASRGINLANGFGTLPGNFIRNNVSTSTCLNTIISASLTPAPICTNDGAVSVAFNANNFGTAPFTYTWSNGAKTQSLASLTTPGGYSVQIRDSNGCTANYSTDLIKRPAPGNGIVPSQKMPVCCGTTKAAVQLTASAPQAVTDCQTVYWLRSTVAPTSYAVAKSIFDTTNSANILPSINESAIQSGSGAILEAKPPVSCVAKQSFYYTVGSPGTELEFAL